jgi:hypothetical protein
MYISIIFRIYIAIDTNPIKLNKLTHNKIYSNLIKKLQLVKTMEIIITLHTKT